MEKRIIVFVLAAAFQCAPSALQCIAAVSGAGSASVEAAVAVKAKKELQTVVFKTHMHCENCVKKVTENLSFVKGVEDLKVSLENQTITVIYDVRKTNSETLAGEITKLGYPAIAVNAPAK